MQCNLYARCTHEIIHFLQNYFFNAIKPHICYQLIGQITYVRFNEEYIHAHDILITINITQKNLCNSHSQTIMGDKISLKV